MTESVVVLTHDDQLFSALGGQLGIGEDLVQCKSLSALKTQLQDAPARALLLHLSNETLDGQSVGRFLGEFNEVVDKSPVYALVEPECPERLRQLGERSADEVLPLPIDVPRLKALLSRDSDPAGELESFWEGLPHKELLGRTKSLVTFTPEMFEMMEEIKVAARHEVTVLLIGETGSGKTYMARLLHELSERREERFCTVACGALPPDLIESELFGYVKGAFTGADANKEGKFAAAGSGTLLLDEIDVLPLEQQAKLLRVIETGEYEPVGSNETRQSKARLIVASNYDLQQLVRGGTFRTDLYYRLNILNFHLLPLRQRPWDIEYLARKFALEHSRTHNIALREIEPAFLTALRAYHWPGNIREMENVVRRAVLYCQRGVLSVRDLPSSIRAVIYGQQRPLQPSPLQVGSGFSPPANGNGATYMNGTAGYGLTGGIPSNGNGANGNGSYANGSYANGSYQNGAYQNGHTNVNGAMNGSGHQGNSLPPGMSEAANGFGFNPANNYAIGGAMPGASANGDGASSAVSLESRVDVLERRIIEDTLRRNNHRRKETAAELGISRVTLYNKMKKFGLLD